jgi:hypothetical protein
MPETVITITRFILIDGVTENEFLAASNIMMKELGLLDGFISRELVKKDDGSWMDVSRWKNMDAATKAEKEVLILPLCLEFFKLIKESSIETGHYNLIQFFEI